MMANVFDQFDQPAASGNVFDQFDAPGTSSNPATSVTADVTKEGGKGLVRGAESLAGDLGEAVMGPFGPSHHFANLMADLGLRERPAPEPGYGQQLATATGMTANPQTTPGKYAGTVGEVLGNPSTYFGPGGLLRKTLAGAAAGAGSEAAGQATEGTALEPAARIVGAAAGLPFSAARAPHVAAPITEELFDAATGHYNAMHGFGVELHPHVMDNTATQITTDLKSTGFRPILAPKTFALIDELRNPEGKYMTTQEVEGVRRALGKVSGDPTDMTAARHAIGAIDDTMAGLTPADAAINGHFAPRVAQEGAQARGNYAAGKRAEQLETATNNAELQAASTGSGANIDNATRQKIRAILTSPSKRRGFNDAELAQMDAIVRGTPAGNVARLLGKLAPTGIVSGTLSAGLGHTVGHTIGVPVLGAVAKAASDAATRRAGARLGEQVRLRSPLSQKMGATATPRRYLISLPAMQAGQLSQTNGDQ